MDPFFYRMPGIGDVPTLVDATTGDMIELAHEKAAEDRMRVAEARKAIWDEDFGPQIRGRLRRWYSDELIANLVCRHVTMAFNPAKDIVKEVAVVYTHGAIRHLMGASEETQKQWTRLYQEDAIQTQSVFANRMAMLMGTVHTVPVVRRDRLLRETKLSNLISVTTAPSDPMGWPTSAVWMVHNGTNERGQTDKRRVAYVVVDREAWHYLNRDGDPVSGPDGESTAPHGCTDENGDPACPVVPLALHDRTDDYWGLDQQNRIHDGNVLVGAIAARLSAVRSTQDHNLLVIRATNKDAVPSKQLAGGDPQRPLELFSGAGGAPADADMLAMMISPEHHIRHIQFVVATMARAYGLSDDAVQVDDRGDTPVMAIKLRNEQRQALRSEQIEPCRAYERRLATLTASLVRYAKHPKADKIPPPDEVHDAFELEVPMLATIDDPDKQQARDEFERKHGLTSIVDIARRDKWPNSTRSETIELLLRNVDEDNLLRRLVAERSKGLNDPMGDEDPDPPAPGESEDEIRGRENGPDGPRVRDGDSPSDDDE